MLKEYLCCSFSKPFSVGPMAISLRYEIFCTAPYLPNNSAGAFCIIKDTGTPLRWKSLPLAELVPQAVGV